MFVTTWPKLEVHLAYVWPQDYVLCSLDFHEGLNVLVAVIGIYNMSALKWVHYQIIGKVLFICSFMNESYLLVTRLCSFVQWTFMEVMFLHGYFLLFILDPVDAKKQQRTNRKLKRQLPWQIILLTQFVWTKLQDHNSLQPCMCDAVTCHTHILFK